MRLAEASLAIALGLSACHAAPQPETLEDPEDSELQPGETNLEHPGANDKALPLDSKAKIKYVPQGTLEKCVATLRSMTHLVHSQVATAQQDPTSFTIPLTINAHNIGGTAGLFVDCDGVDLENPAVKKAFAEHNAEVALFNGALDNNAATEGLKVALKVMNPYEIAEGGMKIETTTKIIFRKIDGKCYYLMPNTGFAHHWREVYGSPTKQFSLDENDKMVQVTADSKPEH